MKLDDLKALQAALAAGSTTFDHAAAPVNMAMGCVAPATATPNRASR